MIDQEKNIDKLMQPDDLLSSPSIGEEAAGTFGQATFERGTCTYKNCSDRFALKEKTFTQQYSHLYAVRLMEMRKTLAVAARRKWGDIFNIKKTVELKAGEKCCVIGILYKKMELKPVILKELSVEHNLNPQPPKMKYIDESDELLLEDESQRMRLIGDIPIDKLITGLIVAVLGFENNNGKFEVEDYCLGGLPYQESPKLDEPLTNGENRYVALISGLGFGDQNQDCLQLQMFSDMVTGQLGSIQDQSTYANVVRVIIAGNCLSQCMQSKMNESKAKYLTRNSVAGSVDATKELDEYLTQLAACVPVDLMPGEYDPSNYLLPQQPLHPCMFPQTRVYSTLQGVTNPYDASIGGVRMLGTAGRNVNDIYRFSGQDNRLDIMKLTLLSGHIAPTAPDTLGSYPFYDKDPFILKECPHIYFVGNQPEYGCHVEGATGQKVTLIMVPDFSKTGCCVLVNLRTLHCQPVVFSSSLKHGSKTNDHVKDMETEI